MILCKRARDVGVEITFDNDWLVVTIYNGLHYDYRSDAALMLMHFFDYTLEEATYYVSEREMRKAEELSSQLADRSQNPRIWQSRTCAAAHKRHLLRPSHSRTASRPRLGTNLSGPYPNVTHGSGQRRRY
ncbi:hypothetical protein FOA52_008909 [Chlamydomonas sp. UWO 241]|nr:hypothetical protein FOA52_008909 [Chlamydomonas sp. UWO 241]